MDRATLERVEQQRLELENNIFSLKKGLRHWQTLDIDYEGIREEFACLNENASYEQCLKAAQESQPQLVTEDELKSVISGKSASQLIDLFEKRLEYVAKNIGTIRKQLSDSERKRNALLLAETTDFDADPGLPLQDIIEELDEDGQIVNSKVIAPGKDANQLLDVLRKAGVAAPDAVNEDQSQADTAPADKNTVAGINIGRDLLAESKDQVSELDSDDDDDSIDNLGAEQDTLGPINLDDTEDDARLRQEMLRYGLDEVGQVVAELDLLETGHDDPDYDFDEVLSDDEDDYVSEESEDERGMTKRPIISDQYKQKMEALQKKLAVDNMQNLGPDGAAQSIREASTAKRLTAAEAARKAAIARDEAAKTEADSQDIARSALKSISPTAQSLPAKKKVGFAEELDIAPMSTSAERSWLSKPISDDMEISERQNDLASIKKPVKRLSKFKAARQQPVESLFPPPVENTAPKPAVTGPANQIISNILIERPETDQPPLDPSEINEELHKREVAVEYQRARNVKIHEQGGYVRGGEQENYDEPYAPMIVEDSITGKPRKVSRFRAAKISQ